MTTIRKKLIEVALPREAINKASAREKSIRHGHLNRVPLWRGDHVPVKVLVEDFAKYLYLPRLQEPRVLLNAIRDGLALITWEKDAFAYAESFDETASRYRGLEIEAEVKTGAPDSVVRVVTENCRVLKFKSQGFEKE